jgi:hypothetical protein
MHPAIFSMGATTTETDALLRAISPEKANSKTIATQSELVGEEWKRKEEKEVS